MKEQKVADPIKERITITIHFFSLFTSGQIQGTPVSSWKIIPIREPQ
jgi:hypothetical protein